MKFQEAKKETTTLLADKSRATRYSKINLDIIVYCLNLQDNNRYNISIQFSIQYQVCGDKNVKNLVLSYKLR